MATLVHFVYTCCHVLKNDPTILQFVTAGHCVVDTCSQMLNWAGLNSCQISNYIYGTNCASPARGLPGEGGWGWALLDFTDPTFYNDVYYCLDFKDKG